MSRDVESLNQKKYIDVVIHSKLSKINNKKKSLKS